RELQTPSPCLAWVARATRPPRSATRRAERDRRRDATRRSRCKRCFCPFRRAGRPTAQASRLCYPTTAAPSPQPPPPMGEKERSAALVPELRTLQIPSPGGAEKDSSSTRPGVSAGFNALARRPQSPLVNES